MRESGNYILFHHTTQEDARAILDDGFRNDCGSYLSNRTWAGVWLSASPEVASLTTSGVSLAVKLAMTENELERWEWTGEGRQTREWLIPARVLNAKVAGVSLETPQQHQPQPALVAA